MSKFFYHSNSSLQCIYINNFILKWNPKEQLGVWVAAVILKPLKKKKKTSKEKNQKKQPMSQQTMKITPKTPLSLETSNYWGFYTKQRCKQDS